MFRRARWLIALLPPLGVSASPASVAAERAPRLLDSNEVVWPEMEPARHDVLVPVLLVVSEHGDVQSVTLEAAVGEPFDSLALERARAWRFEPATGSDGATAARIRTLVRFKAPKIARGVASQSATSSAQGQPQRRAKPEGAAAESELPRHEVSVRGAPPTRSASATVRDRAILQAAPHRTGSDLLSTVPGVFLTQHSGEGKAHQIFFRGFDAVHGQDVELWVAGAPANDVSNIHGQGYADLHFIIPEVVNRIEAQPGIYDPRQGDFAVAGTLRYHLGYDQPGLTASTMAGSFGARRAFLGFRPAARSEENFGALELYRTDGFGVGRAAERASAMAQLSERFGPDLHARVMASFYTSRFDSAGVVRADDVSAERIDRFGSYDTNQGGTASRMQVVGELGQEAESSTTRFSPFLIRRGLKLRYNFTGYLVDPVNGDTTEQSHDATTVGLASSYRKRLCLFRTDDWIEMGVSVRSSWIEQRQDNLSIASGRVVESIVDADARVHGVGGYVDTELHPVSRVALRGGVRLEGIGISVDDKLDGGAARSSHGLFAGERITLDVAIAPGLHGVASWGRGFRSPQARSLAPKEGVPFTRVRSGEVGFRYLDGSRFGTSIAVFRTVLSDDIVFDETVARNEPVPGTVRSGVAVDLTSKANDWFVSALGFTYTHAAFRESSTRFQSGDLVPFVPQAVMRADLTGSAPLGSLLGRAIRGSLGTGLSYLYRRPLPFAELGSNAFVTDARASLRAREIELSLETFNLFNVSWNDGEFVYASNFERGGSPSLIPARHFTAGAPRSVLLSLTVHI